ncbi:MAG: hypothetical protein ACJA0X_001425 [Cyclobacteriaceae bacterium]|jgi:hypothetical protein
MKQYMYLFRGGDEGYTNLSPEEMQAHMMKWTEWMKVISQNDDPVAGAPLHGGGKIVKNSGALITDGPFAEGKEIVGGYVIVEASDLEMAVDMSKACPIFDFNGFVEVREVVGEN